MSEMQAVAQRWLPIVVTALLTAGLVGLATVEDSSSRGRRAQRAASPTTASDETPAATETTEPPVAITTVPPTPIKVPESTYKGPVTVVSGRVLDFGGRPVRGVEVRLQEHLGIIESLGRALATLMTFGTYCRGSSAPVDCKETSHGVSDASGRYTIRLFASIEEVRAADDFDLIAKSPAGAVTTVLLPEIPSANSVAPDVSVWEPMQLRGNRASWRPGREPSMKYTLTFGFDERDSQRHVYSKEAQPDGIEFEPRILEDMNGWAQARATAGKTTWLTPKVPYRGPGAPISRSRPCTVVPDDPKVQATRYESCPATDPDDTTRLNVPYQSKNLVIDLGAPRRFDTAIVKDFPGSFTIHVSNDGKTWAEAMTSANSRSEGEYDIVSGSRQNARYVRFTIERWSFFHLEHVSIW